MNKKRDDCASSTTRNNTQKGQITIFMILGIVILVVFLFLMAIVNNSQKSNLKAEQEKIFESIYPKAGINLYLEDCLQDPLASAITTISKQGRLWMGLNPGGFIAFEDGKSGTYAADGTPVAYGLIYTPFSTYPNAYPCSSEENNPQFCQYHYPDTTVKFGSLTLDPSIIQEDIQRYLQDEVVNCAKSLAKNKISADASVEVPDPQFSVHLKEDAVSVEATIPFSLTLHGVHYFTTSSFALAHPTTLLGIVETAGYYPLQADRDYVDFNFSKEDILINRDYTFASIEDVKDSLGLSICQSTDDPLKNYLLCTQKLVSGYASLGVEMKTEMTAKGDVIYSFSSPQASYRFARQNRPPALDYIQRFACPAGGYDYLAIEGDPVLGSIDVNVESHDPDETVAVNTIVADSSSALVNEDKTNKDHFLVSKPKAGNYIVKATASDGRLEDNQDVRVLVDNPITATLIVKHHYEKELPLETDKGVALVSAEDPISVNVELPKPSLTKIPPEIHFKYTSNEQSVNLDTLVNVGLSFPSFIFPYSLKNQNILINSITSPSLFDFHPFAVVPAPASGELTLDYTINYCGLQKQTGTSTVPIHVAPCLPYRNQDHPFPYPNQDLVDKDHDGLPDRDSSGEIRIPIDPFLANHTCCLGDPGASEVWSIAQPNEQVACFKDKVDESKAVGCFENKNYPLGNGILLEKKIITVTYCDGTRGNTCEGEKEFEFDPNYKNICGRYGQTDCKEIDSHCAGQKPWSKGGGYWCDGNVGCGEEDKDKTTACTTEIVTNVRDLGFENINDGTQYDCNCKENKFGDGEHNLGNSCFNLKTNSQGKCQRNGWWVGYTYFCS